MRYHSDWLDIYSTMRVWTEIEHLLRYEALVTTCKKGSETRISVPGARSHVAYTPRPHALVLLSFNSAGNFSSPSVMSTVTEKQKKMQPRA